MDETQGGWAIEVTVPNKGLGMEWGQRMDVLNFIVVITVHNSGGCNRTWDDGGHNGAVSQGHNWSAWLGSTVGLLFCEQLVHITIREAIQACGRVVTGIELSTLEATLVV